MAPGAKGAKMIEREENVEMPDRLRRSAEMSAKLEARRRHHVWDRARRLRFEAEGLLEELVEEPPEGLAEVRGEEGGLKFIPLQ